MRIPVHVIYAFVSLCLFMHSAAAAAVETPVKKNTASPAQLEQRIAELEKVVQSLTAQQKKYTLNTSTAPKLSDSSSSIPVSGTEQTLINQNKIAQNSASIKDINAMSEQAEMAIYSYEYLSEEINNSIKISGYADVEYKGSSEPGVNEEFRMHHLSLFFTKRLGNNIKFFSEIEYEDTPKFEGVNDGSGDLKVASGKIFVEALNFDWNNSQYLNMRVGRFFTPAGIWSEDHYPPFVTTQERPLHIRKIFPQLVDGMSVFGSTEVIQNHFFNYTSYLGNGESSTNTSGKKDINSSKAVGFKGDYYAPWLDDFLLGFTLYQDNNDSSNNDAEKFAYGYHLKLRQDNFTLQSEYAKGNFDFEDTLASALNNYHSEGYYAQLVYKFKQWGLGYRYDVYNKTSISLEKTTRNSIFLNYHVNANFTIKGEYHNDSFDDPLKPDYGFYILSVTGYLGG